MSKQLQNAESENSMLLNAAEALEKEALQNNEEKARMMTQYEKVCLDNRQLNRMLEEANKRKVVSNDTNGYDFRDQQRRGIGGLLHHQPQSNEWSAQRQTHLGVTCMERTAAWATDARMDTATILGHP